MGKRKERQRDTAFTLPSNVEFIQQFYDRRYLLDDATRLRVEREAKARRIRNAQKRTR